LPSWRTNCRRLEEQEDPAKQHDEVTPGKGEIGDSNQRLRQRHLVLEIVLGIDNLVFIAILADKLPPKQRDKARLIGRSVVALKSKKIPPSSMMRSRPEKEKSAIVISGFVLIVLEIVLGIDNLVFIAILADKLPPKQRDKARLRLAARSVIAMSCTDATIDAER
jgi:hypothetical protein